MSKTTRQTELRKPIKESHLLSSGYMRKYFTDKNINPADLAQIVTQFLINDWKFDYYHDFENTGAIRHNITNHGKTVKCNCKNCFCACFFATFLFGMPPKSGIYKIKFKIDRINNGFYSNTIGIISETSQNTHDQNNPKMKKDKNSKEEWYWDDKLYNYIGWSAYGCQINRYLPNGLYCGRNNNNIKNNIFRKNNFVYCSNNKNYINRLPSINEGDIIVLEYNSNISILSFSKENDNGKLDSYIKNLPKHETFCWFVGHGYGEMCLTVVH